MSAKGPVSLYDVLGLPPGASAQDVREARRRLARQHHPDRGEATDSEAMALINQAYEVLSDADRRARYDFGRGQAAEPRRPGRVSLPANRTRARLAWGAAGTLAAASAAWVLVGLLVQPAATQPAPASTRASDAAFQRRPEAPPPSLLQGAGQDAADTPLRLIPARRIEARPVATAAKPTPATGHAGAGPRQP